MTTSRKVFAAMVSLPANQATSVNQLMRDSLLHWGYETAYVEGAQPSLDSIIGTELSLTPTALCFLGSDANVRAADGATTYMGIPITTAGFSATDPGKYGIIDPNQFYLYNQSGCQVAIFFQAR